MVSRKWITTLVAAEESSTQVEVALTAALDSEDLSDAAANWASPELQAALAARDHDALAELTTAGQIPLLLAVSENGCGPSLTVRILALLMVRVLRKWKRPHRGVGGAVWSAG